ncbi:hypothetical protein ILYODFUR_035349 [Ilyodon furcidens]|uniref:Uncharacterized protein n=1 Tax=Ilyodon furcidens TaxID=33524 RepID=A0ABV0TSE6_9TELE
MLHEKTKTKEQRMKRRKRSSSSKIKQQNFERKTQEGAYQKLRRQQPNKRGNFTSEEPEKKGRMSRHVCPCSGLTDCEPTRHGPPKLTGWARRALIR